MKVLFIIQDEKLPSSRVRVLNLCPELMQTGISTEVVHYPGSLFEKRRLIKRCGQFDIVYLQKKLPSPLETALIRKYARKLIFDFDDAIYYRHSNHGTLFSRSRYLKFKYIVQKADVIVAGNRILADYSRQFNRHVEIIPSSVETRNTPRRNHKLERDVTIIGWVGGSVNLPYLGLLSSEIFPRLSADHRIKVRILSGQTFAIPSVDVEFIPWKLETQEREIAHFDIGVMPLPKTRYTEGKCGYKALQYMAANVPPVCSDVGINRDIVEDGREGFVVSSNEAFYPALKKLIEDPSLRQELGANARQKVEQNFSIEIVGKRLAQLLKEVYEGACQWV